MLFKSFFTVERQRIYTESFPIGVWQMPKKPKKQGYKEDTMKKNTMIILGILVFLAGYGFSSTEEIPSITPLTDAAESLDLQAVGELFRESETLEAFEKALNDPNRGINNLDLDENGEVDFILVNEEEAENTHVVVLQVAVSEDEIQDIATIEIEQAGEEEYNMQIHGSELIYGTDYYVVPQVVHVSSWPIIRWMSRPSYHPYRSVYYYGVYPRWWKPWRQVSANIYRIRVVHVVRHKSFKFSRQSRVHSWRKVGYRPHVSPRVLRSSRIVPRKTKVRHRTHTAPVRKSTVRKAT